MRFEIQHLTICDGWINCWSNGETAEPTTYASFAEALEDLDDFLENQQEAYFNGWIDSRYERDDYQIVEIA